MLSQVCRNWRQLGMDVLTLPCCHELPMHNVCRSLRPQPQCTTAASQSQLRCGAAQSCPSQWLTWKMVAYRTGAKSNAVREGSQGWPLFQGATCIALGRWLAGFIGCRMWMLFWRDDARRTDASGSILRKSL